MSLIKLTIIIWLIYLLYVLYEYSKYRISTYKDITHNNFIRVFYNKGLWGEYLIYDRLKKYEKEHNDKFLFNVYVPEDSGKTSEIDVLMITHMGIIVFENKNYSGWIFGNDEDQYWMQSIKPEHGKIIKNKFYNPIKQNETHIKYLKEYLIDNYPIYSMITFSNRCELKSITCNKENVFVMQRKDLKEFIRKLYRSDNILSDEQINQIYNKLYPLTQVSKEEKQKHIDEINSRIK